MVCIEKVKRKTADCLKLSKKIDFAIPPETGGTRIFVSRPVPHPAQKLLSVPSRPVSRDLI
jgi:hypothetical protein